MNIEEVREYCLSFKGVTESFPFDEVTLVFKVMGKMFCLASLDGEPRINLRNDPEKNVEMRESYSEIIEGYHMNKVHWNTVYLNGSLKWDFVKELISDSYNIIASTLTKAKKEELKKL